MTNKEAIKILQEQQAKFNDEYIDYGGVNEAYKLAIKALEDLGYAQGYIDGSTGADWREEE